MADQKGSKDNQLHGRYFVLLSEQMMQLWDAWTVIRVAKFADIIQQAGKTTKLIYQYVAACIVHVTVFDCVDDNLNQACVIKTHSLDF